MICARIDGTFSYGGDGILEVRACVYSELSLDDVIVRKERRQTGSGVEVMRRRRRMLELQQPCWRDDNRWVGT